MTSITAGLLPCFLHSFSGEQKTLISFWRPIHHGAYVITDNCIKDSLCVEVCPTDCIHPKQDEPGFEAATQMYVDPEGCLDCGACVPACGSDSIHALEDVPEEKKEFIEKNAAHFKN
ncbi:MAG TPA: ferredoxin family protein [Candidatus Sulfotelmatobacter sp.]|nr:ferredoxin family protein [Candidatus Sulfotelmatobacter sp.]